MSSNISIPSRQNLESFSLLWLDNELLQRLESLKNPEHLQPIINYISLFQDVSECEAYIQQRTNDLIVLILAEKQSKELLPRIHDLAQIKKIYINTCDNNEHENNYNDFSKVNAVMTDINELFDRIRLDRIKPAEVEEVLSISIFNNISLGAQGNSSADINGDFLRFQLLIDYFTRFKSSPSLVNELIEQCKRSHEDSSNQLTIFFEFQRDYSSDRAIWWYTRECFVYKALNKALRLQDINTLFLLSFLIRDIYQQLKYLQRAQLHQWPIRVFRRQTMTMEELANLQRTVGKLISINSFLSTSTNRDQTLLYLGDCDSGDGLKRIFFDIDVRNSEENVARTKPFAFIASQSYFPDENEVLFMIGSIFRVTDIHESENGIWFVRMILCDDDDHELKSLLAYMRDEQQKKSDLFHFSQFLRDWGKFDQAECVLRQLLDDMSDVADFNPVSCYYELGRILDAKGEYDESIQFKLKLLELSKQKTTRSEFLSLSEQAVCYNDLAIVYQKNGELEKSLESNLKAMAIYQRIYGDQSKEMSVSYNNVALVYYEQKNFAEALVYHLKALAIQENLLPSDHAHLAATHNNLGGVYRALGQTDQALTHYERSLAIKLRSLPSNHPNLAMAYKNIGTLYILKKDRERASFYIEKARTIFNQVLSYQHPDINGVERALGLTRAGLIGFIPLKKK